MHLPDCPWLPSLCATHMHCEISRLLWSPADFSEGPGQTSLDALTEVAESHVYVARNKLQHCTDELNTFWLSLKNKGQILLNASSALGKRLNKRSFTWVDLIISIWRRPVWRNRQEAAPRPPQCIDDRHACVHDRTRHRSKHKLWWWINNLH